VVETTAGGLVATLGYLAIYQNEQDTAYAEIERVVGHGRDPVQITFVLLASLLKCFPGVRGCPKVNPSFGLLPRSPTTTP
jgi:hypothetical protein